MDAPEQGDPDDLPDEVPRPEEERPSEKEGNTVPDNSPGRQDPVDSTNNDADPERRSPSEQEPNGRSETSKLKCHCSLASPTNITQDKDAPEQGNPSTPEKEGNTVFDNSPGRQDPVDSTNNDADPERRSPSEQEPNGRSETSKLKCHCSLASPTNITQDKDATEQGNPNTPDEVPSPEKERPSEQEGNAVSNNSPEKQSEHFRAPQTSPNVKSTTGSNGASKKKKNSLQNALNGRRKSVSFTFLHG